MKKLTGVLFLAVLVLYVSNLNAASNQVAFFGYSNVSPFPTLKEDRAATEKQARNNLKKNIIKWYYRELYGERQKPTGQESLKNFPHDKEIGCGYAGGKSSCSLLVDRKEIMNYLEQNLIR